MQAPFFYYNNHMKQGAKSGRILPVVLILLSAAALGLGILQFRWLTMVSKLQEERLRKSLWVSVEQIQRSCNEEIWSLRAPLSLTPDEFKNNDFERVAATIGYWMENTQFPELLDSIYAIYIPGDGEPESKVYDKALGTFTEVRLPEELQPLLVRDGTGPDDFFPMEERLLRKGYFIGQLAFFIWQDRPQNGDRGKPMPPAEILLPIRVSMEAMFKTVIPHFMDQYLDGYPYRIIKNNSEAATAGPVMSFSSAAPDIVIDIYGPILARIRPLMVETVKITDAGNGTDSPRPNTTSRLFLPFLKDFENLGKTGNLPESAATLEIYYPGSPIDRLVFVQRLINTLVSSGVLLLLMASTIVMYSLYRRTLAQKIIEQEFTASMSHELRTPIAVLKSAADNLAEGIIQAPERLKEYGSIMSKEVTRLSRMVEGILFYSGLEQVTALPDNAVETDVGALLEDLSDSFKVQFEQENCVLDVELNNLSEPVPVSGEALRLIIENLLMNGIRHGLPANPSAENPASLRLIVSRQPFGRELALIVEDRGPGIPQKEQAKIFEPFVRGEASVREQRPGSGLGLHLVKRITELLKGTIAVESPYRDFFGRDCAGARFAVRLPIPYAGRENGKGDDG